MVEADTFAGSPHITRARFFALTGLDVDTHTALKRRGLMPVSNGAERTYTPFEAFAYLLADRLSIAVEGRRRGRPAARDIVRAALPSIIARAADIMASFEVGPRSRTRPGIYVGVLVATGCVEKDIFVGSLKDLSGRLSVGGVTDVRLVSATRVYADMAKPARSVGIDLKAMWPLPSRQPGDLDG